MADRDLRALERAARDARDDLTTWIHYLRALDREGKEPPDDLATDVKRVRELLARQPGTLPVVRIEEGDEVWVEEKNNPWIVGRWRGIVTAARTLDGVVQYRVRPLFPDEEDPDAEQLPWRLKPLPEQRVRGLELASEDVVELIRRRA